MMNLRKALFYRFTLAFWAGIFMLNSCTTETEIIIPEAPPKLVISSFISPEKPLTEVSVSKSAALLSPENDGEIKVVPDADVWLSDGTDSVKLTFDGNSLYWTNSFPILPGKTYTLRATAPGGFAAKASCRVPTKINQSLTARIDSSEVNPNNPDNYYRLETRWQDLPGEGDYYRVHAVEATGFPGSPVITSRQALPFLEESQVRDLDADGRSWQLSTDALLDFKQERADGTLKFYDVYLFTTDRAYYEFHKSLYQYQLNNSFTDPIKLYSNVSGGLGIFGAYRMQTIQLQIR